MIVNLAYELFYNLHDKPDNSLKHEAIPLQAHMDDHTILHQHPHLLSYPGRPWLH